MEVARYVGESGRWGNASKLRAGVAQIGGFRVLAAKAGIEMPIVAQVHAALFEGATAREVLENLMLREPKPEQWQ